jgi:hypothetical protein
MKAVILFLATITLSILSVIYLPKGLIYLIGCYQIGSFFGWAAGKLMNEN